MEIKTYLPLMQKGFLHNIMCMMTEGIVSCLCKRTSPNLGASRIVLSLFSEEGLEGGVVGATTVYAVAPTPASASCAILFTSFGSHWFVLDSGLVRNAAVWGNATEALPLFAPTFALVLCMRALIFVLEPLSSCTTASHTWATFLYVWSSDSSDGLAGTATPLAGVVAGDKDIGVPFIHMHHQELFSIIDNVLYQTS
eukprot:7743772-Ditylum_brightwellii.AAC.1